MAKYSVLFSCGHKGEIEIEGDAAAVEKRIKYLSEKGTCTTCFCKSKKNKKRELTLEVAQSEDKKGVIFTFVGNAYVVKERIKSLGFKFDGSKWSKSVPLKALDETVSDIKAAFPDIMINTDKLIYQKPKHSLYDVTATEVLETLSETVVLKHSYLTKAKAKKLVLNALLGNVVIEEIMGQVDFLIENGGYSE